jgi:hypothetical protein
VFNFVSFYVLVISFKKLKKIEKAANIKINIKMMSMYILAFAFGVAGVPIYLLTNFKGTPTYVSSVEIALNTTIFIS